MHNLIYTVSILILSISSLFGQGYDDISDFGVYRDDWALVLKDGLYGFIDTDGLEVFLPKNYLLNGRCSMPRTLVYKVSRDWFLNSTI